MSKITIIVPVYRISVEHLKQCITSIQQQTLKDIEIILVDDGADRIIANICDEHGKKDERIKVIHKENHGVSSARNEGIKCAKSDYIMFVDADDWIEKDCCQKIYEYIKQNKQIDIICWSYYKNYRNFEEKNIIFEKKDIINCTNTKRNYYDMKIIGNVWTKLYSKRILEKVYFNEELSYGEDVEFNFRIFKKAKFIMITNETFYHYRIQNESSVRKYNIEMLEKYEKTLMYIKDNIEFNNKMQRDAYYSFGAVAYLMICMNSIFTKENSKSYLKKIKNLNELSKRNPYKDIFKNTDKVKLPFTRKLPLLLAKYHLYIGLVFMINVKKILMSR